MLAKIQMYVNRATRLVNAVSRWSTLFQRKSSAIKFSGRKHLPLRSPRNSTAFH